MITAIPEAFVVHLLHHFEHAAFALWLALREEAQMGNFCRSEQNSGGIWTGSHARAAANTSRCIHSKVRVFLGNGHGVRIGRRPRSSTNKTAGLHDAVKCLSINDQVFDDRKSAAPERFDEDGVAIFKIPHVNLAGCAADRCASEECACHRCSRCLNSPWLSRSSRACCIHALGPQQAPAGAALACPPQGDQP